MNDVWLLSEAQMRRIEPLFPLSYGISRVDKAPLPSSSGCLNESCAQSA
jgi:hypothetical protein